MGQLPWEEDILLPLEGKTYPEYHVLSVMGDAVEGFRLVPRTGADDDGDLQSVHFFLFRR